MPSLSCLEGTCSTPCSQTSLLCQTTGSEVSFETIRHILNASAQVRESFIDRLVLVKSRSCEKYSWIIDSLTSDQVNETQFPYFRYLSDQILLDNGHSQHVMGLTAVILSALGPVIFTHFHHVHRIPESTSSEFSNSFDKERI